VRTRGSFAAALFYVFAAQAIANVHMSGFSVSPSTTVSPQTWTPLAQQPTFYAGTALLLTDGSVMVQDDSTPNWWQLIPDSAGDYVNGTWKPLQPMQSTYGPNAFASAVLPDGRLIIEGGEHNFFGGQTNQGAIYDPVADSWQSINAPTGWGIISDAQSVVLPNGTFMLGSHYGDNEVAIFNQSNLSWTIVYPTNKNPNDGSADEEGWTLLPSGNVLTVDVHQSSTAEVYSPTTQAWSGTMSTVVNLADLGVCYEMGPAVLRPDGTVFAIGATNQTAVYNSTTNQWSAGPSLSSISLDGDGAPDAPAAVLPNGKVLFSVAPTTPSNCFNTKGLQFLEFDGVGLTKIASPTLPDTGQIFDSINYLGRMLVLPTGQILYTPTSKLAWVYNPEPGYNSAWAPTITSVPTTLLRGHKNYIVNGRQLNGMTQGAMYGDDAQTATNYPLVRITNSRTGRVRFARTHTFSTMGVATGTAIVSAQFDIPADIELGAASLVAVTNGIPSAPVNVNIICKVDSIFCDGFDLVVH